VVSFLQVSPPRPCTQLSFPPYALHLWDINYIKTFEPLFKIHMCFYAIVKPTTIAYVKHIET
jgi:hypothetical protein